MQPLKISILGDFWDCQIYRGRLYLWTMDGRLLTYRWDDFISSLPVEEELELALKCAFCRGDYLYNPEFGFLFSDREIVGVLRAKFEKLAQKTFIFQPKDISKYLCGEQDNPAKTLSIDSDIYKNKLFFTTDSGLWKTSVHRGSKKYPVSSRPQKLWDCRLLSLKASSNGRLALSAGDNGLYEYDSEARESFSEIYSKGNFKKIETNLHLLNKRHSFMSNWNYQSIYSTSNVDESYMMLFGWDKRGADVFKLKYVNSINESKLFQESAESSQLSWGGNNKIYKTSPHGGIEVVDYAQGRVSADMAEAFTRVQHVPFQDWKGPVISGGTAYFGVIVECENALVVMKDDNDFFNIPEAVTRWRVYPRSIRYENHLHVISDNKLDIYSFNHDYFRLQKGKKIGMRHSGITFRRQRPKMSEDDFSVEA